MHVCVPSGYLVSVETREGIRSPGTGVVDYLSYYMAMHLPSPSLKNLTSKDAGLGTEVGKQCQNGCLSCELGTIDGKESGKRERLFLQKGWKTGREFGF